MFGNSPPPSRYTRFGLSAKMPRAPPYVHFSWLGSVARSLGQPSCTSYGPEMSSAPIAVVTAAAVVAAAGAAAASSARVGIRRLPSGTPAARPTAKAKRTVAPLLMTPSLRGSDYTRHKSQGTSHKAQTWALGAWAKRVWEFGSWKLGVGSWELSAPTASARERPGHPRDRPSRARSSRSLKCALRR